MKILCADDDREILNLVNSFFSLRGHAVELANTAFGLSRKIAEFQPDVLLLDYRMPGLSGENFMAIFQHSSHARNTAVVYFSAEDPSKFAAAVGTAGVRGWIPKSVIGLELVRRVEELVAATS